MATSIERVVFLSVLLCFVHKINISGQRIKEKDIPKYRQRVFDMFHHAYDGYIKYAYPYDELRPLTCDGHDTWGSFSLTLIDGLSTLAIMGNHTEFKRVAKMLIEEMDFDIDINASVFETNIRILGGLLSGHLLSKRAGMDLEPGWPCSGPLLRLADSVARRLLPAFDTPTGMPYGTINLRHGVPKGETTVTCTAGVGTFIVEFGTLSRLTGDPVFEKVAMRAMRALWERRSEIGLVGNHIDVSSGKWTAVDAGIGGGIDSYFEYLVKGGIMFDIPELLEQFHEYAAAAEKHLKRDDWYMWANMKKGGITLPMFTSLDGYFPGIQSMLGDIDKAMKTIHNFHQVARQFGFPPEYYNIPKTEAHKGREGYPLRPELIESAVYLYRATKDPYLLEIGVDMLEAMELITKTKCGFATVNNVNVHMLENRMESFFLAETTKYLYLLFDPDNFIHNNGSTGTVIQTPNGECVIDAGGYFFNTEAHPIDTASVYCCSAQKKEDDKILQDWHDNLDLLAMLDIVEPSDTVRGRKLKDLKEESEKLKKKLQEEKDKIRMEENLRKIQELEEQEKTKGQSEIKEHVQEVEKTENTLQQGDIIVDNTENKWTEKHMEKASQNDKESNPDVMLDKSKTVQDDKHRGEKQETDFKDRELKNSLDHIDKINLQINVKEALEELISKNEKVKVLKSDSKDTHKHLQKEFESDESVSIESQVSQSDLLKIKTSIQQSDSSRIKSKVADSDITLDRVESDEKNNQNNIQVKQTITENVDTNSTVSSETEVSENQDTSEDSVNIRLKDDSKVSTLQKKLSDLKEALSLLDEWKLNLNPSQNTHKTGETKEMHIDKSKVEYKLGSSNLEKIFQIILGNENKNKGQKTPNISNLYNLMHFYPLIYKSKPELMTCKAQPFHMRMSVLGEMFVENN